MQLPPILPRRGSTFRLAGVSAALLFALLCGASGAGADTTYTVQPGDTLSRIAAEFDVPVSELVRLNAIGNPSLIYVGQRLTIPGGASPSPPTPTPPSPGPSTGAVHIVQAGETLSGIADRYGTSTSALATANDISNPSLIYIGQRLTISEAPGSSAPPAPSPAPAPAGPGSLLASTRVVSFYGNPYSSLMGVLGRYDPQTLIAKLRDQAADYVPVSRKTVQPALQLIATVAQSYAGADGMYRLRMPTSLIQEWSDLAERNGLLLILDLQVGRSTVEAEVNAVLPFLKKPHVHLALDPEFDMWGSDLPGQTIGHMTADEVNYAIRALSTLVSQHGLPNKVLVVHQFTDDMLQGKGAIISDPRVDTVLDMDGFGNQGVKSSVYRSVQAVPLQFAGIKLFYIEDTDLFSPAQLMELEPVPSVIIYQ